MGERDNEGNAYDPAGQALQDVESADEEDPGEQLSQDRDPDNEENEPTGQEAQDPTLAE